MYRKVFASKVFERKVVLVTGGCSGIGRALVLRFAQAGARPVILDLHREELDSLVLHLREHLNSDAMGLVCDVSDPQAVERIMTLVTERCGGIDLLVNNAGITHRSRFADTPRAVFERIMAVNYFGALYCTQAALPSLLERRGQIIVLSSLSGFVPLHLRCAYNASKHALHGLFDTLRQEGREEGRDAEHERRAHERRRVLDPARLERQPEHDADPAPDERRSRAERRSEGVRREEQRPVDD